MVDDQGRDGLGVIPFARAQDPNDVESFVLGAIWFVRRAEKAALAAVDTKPQWVRTLTIHAGWSVSVF